MITLPVNLATILGIVLDLCETAWIDFDNNLSANNFTFLPIIGLVYVRNSGLLGGLGFLFLDLTFVFFERIVINVVKGFLRVHAKIRIVLKTIQRYVLIPALAQGEVSSLASSSIIH